VLIITALTTHTEDVAITDKQLKTDKIFIC